jgi:protein-disulfide isomerase
MHLSLGVLVLALAVAPLACADDTKTEADTSTPTGDHEVVAVVDGEEITAEEVKQLIASQLLQLRQQEYDLKTAAIEQLAYEKLQADAAEAAGLSVEELRQQKILDQVSEVTEEQIQQTIEQYRSRLPQDEKEARARVVQFLEGQRMQQQEEAFKSELMSEASVRVLLEPPRLEVPVDAEDPADGPADAPVTIVEFTDFECPYCLRVQPTLERLKSTYGDKVRHVFKQLPLDMHANAQFTAEASLCAQAQGKFWELHDWMFANVKQLGSPEAVYEAAASLGLDAEALKACVDNDTMAEAVAKDLREARSVGASSTPTFFVNGRLLRGAKPYEEFAEIIDSELAKSSASSKESSK